MTRMVNLRVARLLFRIGIILFALGIVVACLKINANWRINEPLSEQFISKQLNSTDLVVIVHGYQCNTNSMADVRDAITNTRPNADVILLGYPAHTFSNADCFEVADRLAKRIGSCFATNRYEHITLVGFSMGALLLRKAYVYGHGYLEDAPATAIGAAQTNWVAKVERFVLLAGMNRGWTSRNRPNGMRLHKAILIKLGTVVGRLTKTARLIRQCEQGEPFVVNLRIQWLRLIRSLAVSKQPTVVQLLGDIDDVVTRDDNRDVIVSKDFVWVTVNGTKHGNAIKFREPILGEERRTKFVRALGNSSSLEDLRQESPRVPNDTDTNVVALVIVLHGIRDLGEWTSQFEAPMQAAFRRTHADGKKLLVYHPSYGYFAMGAFLLWSERQTNVRWFMDEFTELMSKYPNLENDVDFVGHSNGTYVLASALEKYKTLRIRRAVFAGSVVPVNYNWNAVTGRVERIRNYIGSADWVVALFPRLFEVPVLHALKGDIGSAGYRGFASGFGTNGQIKIAYGGHSAALDRANTQSIAAFVIEGITQIQSNAVTSGQPTLCARAWNAVLPAASSLCLLVWIAIAGILGCIGSILVCAVAWVYKILSRWLQKLENVLLRMLGLDPTSAAEVRLSRELSIKPPPVNEPSVSRRISTSRPILRWLTRRWTQFREGCPANERKTLRTIVWAVYSLLIWFLLNTI